MVVRQGHSLRVLQFANSFVGKPGNIGVRTHQILERLSTEPVFSTCLSRGTAQRISGVHYHTMGWKGQLARALNGLRIYLAPAFKHRPWDIALFQGFSRAHLRLIPGTDTAEIAHVWDMCPRLIDDLKRRGSKVVLDVAIAPMTFNHRLTANGKSPTLTLDQRLGSLERQAFDKADVLVAPSYFVRNELTAQGIPLDKIKVIPFGAPADFPAARHLAHGIENPGIKFCFLGAIGPRKGVPDIIKAWDYPAFTEDQLHLCGRVYPATRREISSNLSGRIVQPGFINPRRYLPMCNVFVFPSWLEGSSKAVMEAMACGLPVITTPNAGSVVRDGIDGFVIEAGDIAALRSRMMWFKNNPHEIVKMGQAARDFALTHTTEDYTRAILNLYARLSA